MLQSLSAILGDPLPMMQKIDAYLEEVGLPKDLTCDHICYRVSSFERYEELKQVLFSFGSLEAETMVRGRPISIFRLWKPLTLHEHRVECIELPAPKPDSFYEEGWEHAEFVTRMPLDTFMSMYSDIVFDCRSIRKKVNPEIALAIPPKYQAKFHPTSILEVIAEEKALGFSSIF